MPSRGRKRKRKRGGSASTNRVEAWPLTDYYAHPAAVRQTDWRAGTSYQAVWGQCHHERQTGKLGRKIAGPACFPSNVGQQVEVLIILVLASLTEADLLLGFNELDPIDPLHHLVAELVLNPQA